MSKIMIGAPVRNRAWILDRYCQALVNQEITFEECFVVNDCDDNSEEIINSYGLRTVRYDFGDRKSESHQRGKYDLGNLAEVRNVLIEEFLKSDCEYLVSIDTDIIVPEFSVSTLVEHELDICGMLILNNPEREAYNVMYAETDKRNKLKTNYFHFKPTVRGVIGVDMTGAVYAIHRRVLESGVRYGYHPQGEDVYFCEQANIKGYGIYCDTTLTPIHCYNEDGSEAVAEL